jgi:hypothetical protein
MIKKAFKMSPQYIKAKALQKTEFSKLFVFASFGIVQFLKLGNFSEIKFKVLNAGP